LHGRTVRVHLSLGTAPQGWFLGFLSSLKYCATLGKDR
jgi:hypothetical protein